MIMKPKKDIFSVHMVRNSKPVGRAFKRRPKDNSGPSPVNKFSFKSEETPNQKSNLQNSHAISNKNNWQKTRPSLPSAPTKVNDLEKKQPSKSNTSLSPKKKENGIVKASTSPTPTGKIETDGSSKKLKESSKEANAKEVNANIPVDTKKVTEDGPKQTNKKKPRKKKKKNQLESTDDSYKPVFCIQTPKDISANWKNLKQTIIENDKKASLERNPSGKKYYNKRKAEQMETSDEKKDQSDTKKIKSKVTSKGQTVDSLEKQKKKYGSKVDKGAKEKKGNLDDIWFDNVDPVLLGEEYNEDKETKVKAEKDSKEDDNTNEDQDKGDTKAVAIDCEMVGTGIEGKDSMLARVSIVNEYCNVIYDTYVKPQETIVDYRTEFSGIRPHDLLNAPSFKKVQEEVAKIVEGKILVGHGLNNDLKVLFIQHPRSRIRDTCRYKPFKTMFRGHTPKLKLLTKRILGGDIQTGEHDSVQDAQAVMRLYIAHKKEWNESKKKSYVKPIKKNNSKSTFTDI